MPDPALAPHFLRTRRGRALIYQVLALCALVVVSVCMYGFAAYWLYLPIYAMGQTV